MLICGDMNARTRTTSDARWHVQESDGLNDITDYSIDQFPISMLVVRKSQDTCRIHLHESIFKIAAEHRPPWDFESKF